ncbi:hypothetical protein BDV12DRAFT_100269 [Aspergillus spectabilis]
MADRPRVILEKSRTVRRRYQRSNKRFQFSASQIARIEREEERERLAQKLRDKEKRRVQEKKKKAEKEAKAREERMRRGIPDPNAPTVPASQPLLFSFIKKAPSVSVEPEIEGQDDEGSDTDSTVVASDFDDNEDLDDMFLEDEELDTMFMALGDADEFPVEETKGSNSGMDHKEDDEDEFSDCSAFYDEDIIKTTATVVQEKVSVATELCESSFQDDTALLLEEFAHEFDPGASFDEELAQLDAD